MFKSATSDLRILFLSFSVKGIRQTNSSVSSAASINAAKNSSSLVRAPVLSIPSAVMTPPVKVATSISDAAPCCFAYVVASARTKRPSASVFNTSTVLPLYVVMTSSGLNAVSDTILSVDPITATTFLFGRNSPIIFMAPSTAAAPPISPFIPTIESFGFKE